MEYKDETIILRIKEVMKEHGLTSQTELGRALGVHQSSISDMFKQKRSTMPLVDAISEHWNVSKQWLLTGSGMKYATVINDAELPSLTNTERVELVKKLNDLYARHQEIMGEAQEIMKSIVEINKKLILDGTDIAGV